MSAWKCCGEYNEHAKDCWAERLRAENAELHKMLEVAEDQRDEAERKLAIATDYLHEIISDPDTAKMLAKEALAALAKGGPDGQ